MSLPPTPVTSSRSLDFGGLRIEYDDRVLQPRPWTAAQSDLAAQAWHAGPDGRLLELCAGAGHIGLLALTQVETDGVLVDINPVACAWARSNAAAAGLDTRAEVRERSVRACLEDDEQFAVVVADPPWVPAHQVYEFPADPPLAIDGGRDGLDLARDCVETIEECLHPDGTAVLQLGSVAQADILGDWIAEQPHLSLVPSDVHRHPEQGVLVVLHRSPGVPASVDEGGL